MAVEVKVTEKANRWIVSNGSRTIVVHIVTRSFTRKRKEKFEEEARRISNDSVYRNDVNWSVSADSRNGISTSKLQERDTFRQFSNRLRSLVISKERSNDAADFTKELLGISRHEPV